MTPTQELLHAELEKARKEHEHHTKMLSKYKEKITDYERTFKILEDATETRTTNSGAATVE